MFIVSLLSYSMLNERIDDVSSRIDNIENNQINTLKQQIATMAKTDMLSRLASAKTAMESRLEQTEATITEFQSKDAELEKKISDLKAYADSKIDSTKDWVSETFITLEQYYSILSYISEIRDSIEKLEASMTSLENRISVEVDPAVDIAVSQIYEQVVSGIAAIVLSGYTETVSSVRNEMESPVSRVVTLEVMSR